MTKKAIISSLLYLLLFCLVCASCETSATRQSTKKNSLNNSIKHDEILYLNEIDDPNYLVALLDNSNELEDECIGITGLKSKSFPIYKRLSLVASDTTLLRLTRHQNPKIRVYAMWALIDKNKALALSQINLVKKDNEIVIYKIGCTSIPETVSSLVASKFDSEETH